jgi:hypothetical protein
MRRIIVATIPIKTNINRVEIVVGRNERRLGKREEFSSALFLVDMDLLDLFSRTLDICDD